MRQVVQRVLRLMDARFGWLLVLLLWLWLACLQAALFAAFSPTMRPGFRQLLLWSLPLATLIVVVSGGLTGWRVWQARKRQRTEQQRGSGESTQPKR